MSNWLSQQGRFLHLTSPLGEDALILTEFTAEEALSNPFKLRLHMISDNTNITAEDMLHRPVTVQLNPGEETQPRYFNGIVSHFRAEQIQDGVRHYYAE